MNMTQQFMCAQRPSDIAQISREWMALTHAALGLNEDLLLDIPLFIAIDEMIVCRHLALTVE
jgi:hypothetical protein